MSQVKKVDGVPQVLLKDNLTVQVFFWQDQITLEFEKNRVAEEWANNIRAVASGNMAEFSSSKKRRGSNGKVLDAISTINPDAGLVIDAANSAIGALADVITKRDKKKKLEARQTEAPRELFQQSVNHVVPRYLELKVALFDVRTVGLSKSFKCRGGK